MKKPLSLFVIIGIAVALFSCSKGEKGAVETKAGPAPSFVLADLNNHKVSLKDYSGKVVLLEFFATWCPPCQMAALELKAVYEKYRDKGFVVLAISIDEGPEAVSMVRAFAADHGLSFPLLLDDGSVSRQYGVISIPTSVIIDRQGTIRSSHMGLPPDFSAVLSKEIEALL
ncbi:MAG: peroxiredoxin family protein [Nitrospirota bacterium]